MERESFVIYKSFYEALKDLPDDIRLILLDAIMEYGLYGIEPEDLPPIPRSIFTLIKPQMDANNRKYENGKKGGRPPKAKANQDEVISEPAPSQNVTETDPAKNQTETKRKPKNNQSKTNPKPNVNDNVNVNDNEEKTITTDVVISKKKILEEETLKRRKVFYQSLVPYVEIYGKEMIREFFDYWSEMNRSKSKMKFESERTWELERRLEYWERRSGQFKTTKSNGTLQQQSREEGRVARATDAYARIMRLRAEDEADGGSQIRDD